MVHLEIVTEATEEVVRALQSLLPQLMPDASTSVSILREALRSEYYTLIVLRDGDQRIIGMTSLAVYQLPSVRKAWIEEVIVDSAQRGKGYGRLLVEGALTEAKKKGIEKVDLTSSHHRIPAHKMYRAMAFHQREAYVFRMELADQ
eukprot:Protomagalhaensia_sp_Gyna_25__546@NODE_1257_length_2013_cov_191_559777_g1001_i0_p2_GENE_NODE_1257_length_2013_cov_191_559777_g1001_i0NODE_1257_length_2013_cov_191_559777_g1001_i0_p2_ORF_typecomplete_len146_score27_34Acetyltransf_1/PF00583_25/7e15Acetyltransf_10/PF13673_7/2_7e13Acetyltransf_7/PF13508_7/1_3e09Acetyltransf_4/PF13420_7/1_2e08Acetyltransf_9/PF13527_7/4_7e08GNAT_acetyltran/PF12746_7/1_9e05Acetyltransf_3/PF13302_7/2_4e05Acetyltransf_CG/PF14542_6/0_00022PanZ/PF12568_8/0_0003FR47/PF08445